MGRVYVRSESDSMEPIPKVPKADFEAVLKKLLAAPPMTKPPKKTAKRKRT